ncbi:hypothetical protein [Embleya scabrispora]|uniref:hypothetical protein n=1 Tax=Embleya scabrispora TaxID=159449 RepID=UPI00035DB12A|nr:hypothetical protein [Embleya scabrispora]MYS79599.1 hypothetical protein [Streptomyces sp. SID5474]
MTQEIAARSDEQIRAMHRHLEPLAQRPSDPAMDPINRVLNANLNAFVLERLEGLHTPGRHVGLNDLVPGLLRPDLDPQLIATMDRLFDREIDELVARIRRGRAG